MNRIALKTLYFPTLSGILLCLSLPPWGNGWLVFIALIPLHLFLLEEKYTQKQKLTGSFITGSIYFLVALWPLTSVDAWWWIAPDTFFFIVRAPLWTLGIILLSLYGAVSTYVLYAYLFLTLRAHPTFSKVWLNLLITPLAWAAIETLRTASVFGFGWAHLAYDLYNTPAIAYIAHWVGIAGLTFFIAYINLALSYTIRAHKIQKKSAHAAAIFSTAIIVSSLIYAGGFVSARTYATPYISSNAYVGIPIALINTNTNTDDTTPETYAHIFDLAQTAVETFKKRGSTAARSIVVLPENTFPLFILDEQTRQPIGYEIEGGNIRTLFDTLLSISQQNPSTAFIIGMHTRTDVEYNSLVVLEHGEITNVYRKRNTLPFTEARFIERGGDNTTITLFKDTPRPVVVSPLICSEILLPHLLNQAANSAFILNISNNGVLESPRAEAYNHAVARMRTLETRLPLVHSEKNGNSSLIDRLGRIITQASYSEHEIIYNTIFISR